MAYNSRYQYGTSPRKLVPEYDKKPKKYPKKSTSRRLKTDTKKQTKTKLKEHKQSQAKTILYVLTVFGILFIISYRNSIIAEDFSKIKNLKASLASIEKENEQLKVNIESNLNLKNIEEIATSQLGMQKLNNDQTIYMTLPVEDHVESASEEVVEEENGNWFMNMINSILDKIK